MATALEMGVDDLRIVSILSNDTVFCRTWSTFCGTLELKSSEIYDLEHSFERGTSTKEIIKKILSTWISNSSFANCENLSIKLKENGYISSSEQILDMCGFNKGDRSQSSSPSAINKRTPIEIGDPIWFNTKSPKRLYLGRDEEMKIIQDTWNDCFEKRRMAIVAITGLGGIGKSEIVKNFAYSFYEFGNGHCIWIDSENEQTINQSFQKLAKDHFEFGLEDDNGIQKNLYSLAQETIAELIKGSCLIVLDNMESYNHSILRILSKKRAKQPPTVLKPLLVIITSRFHPATRYLGSECIHIKLQILSNHAATQFFLLSFGLHCDTVKPSLLTVINALCQRLQNYPLAMQQAAAYIKESHTNAPSYADFEVEIRYYLEEFEKEAKKLLNYKCEDFSKTTFLTWKVTLKKIRNTHKIGIFADEIHEILSFFCPDDISAELTAKIFAKTKELEKLKSAKSGTIFEEISRNSIEDEQQAIQLLNDHSVINLWKQKITIHRLVQKVAQINLKDQEKWGNVLTKLLISSQEILEKDNVMFDQMIHFKKIWEHAATIKAIAKNHGMYPERMCWKYHYLGKYIELREFSNGVSKVFESTLEDNNRWVLRFKYWKGVALSKLGDFKKSLQLLEAVYEKEKKLLGKVDEWCIQTSREIGIIYWREQNFDKAMEIFKIALKNSEDVIGCDCQETLAVRSDMAAVTQEQGKNDEALKLFQELLKIQERVLGKENVDTLVTIHNIACIRYSMKQYKDALQLYEAVLEPRKRYLGLDHPHTLNTKLSIALCYEQLGKKEDSYLFVKQVYKAQRKTLGPQHPDTINSNQIIMQLSLDDDEL